MMDVLSSMPLLTLLTFSPLLGVFVLLFIPQRRAYALRVTGIVTTFVPLLLAIIIYSHYDALVQGKGLVEKWPWISIPLNLELTEGFISGLFTIQYHLSIDSFSLPLVLMTTIIASMAAFASLYVKKHWKSYFILFLLFEIGMLGVFMARDLFLFFIFFEWTLVPLYFLIGIWGYMHREQTANQSLLYNGLGSALLLIAFIMLTVTAGFTLDVDVGTNNHYLYTGNIDVIMKNLNDASSFVHKENSGIFLSEGMRTFIFFLLLVAFGVKLPIFPFHTWMLRVHAEAPAPVVMLHAGIMLKMGAYGLIQFGMVLLPQQAAEYAVIIAILGVINVLYGSILAFVQKEFRLILAYSSISHMGFVLLGIAAMNEIGLQGAVMQMVSHGFISALFFLLVGMLLERTGTSRIDELGGLAKGMPFLCGTFLLAGLASLGLPGLSGFVAELLALLGIFGTMKWAAVLSTLGIILSSVYVLRGVLTISYGPRDECYASLRDARFIEAVPITVLAACIVLIGLFPSFVTVPIEDGIGHVTELFKVRG